MIVINNFEIPFKFMGLANYFLVRLVLLSRSNPDIFNLTDRLMDHEEERSQGTFFSAKRNWVVATNSDFLIPISLVPNVVDLSYFKLLILLHWLILFWIIKASYHLVANIYGFEYLRLLQRLNSFVCYLHRN